MIRLLLLLSCLSLCMCGGSPAGFAVFQFVSGEVYILQNGDETLRVRAGVGDRARSSDTIVTGEDSAAELLIKHMGIIRLGPSSRINLSELRREGNIQIRVQEGRAGLFINKLKSNTRVNVVTPTITAGVRGTKFLVGVDEGQDSKFALFDGALGLTEPTGKGEEVVLDQPGEVRLAPGETLSADSVQELSAESIAEMKALEEMTALDRQPPPDASLLPGGVREAAPGGEDLAVPEKE